MNRTLYLPRPWIRSQNPGPAYVKRAYWHRVVRVTLPRIPLAAEVASPATRKKKVITPM
jgi:hypothetical protein